MDIDKIVSTGWIILRFSLETLKTFQETLLQKSERKAFRILYKSDRNLGIDNRATQRRKGKKRKGRFSHKGHEDPDIQAEIKKGKIVGIL